MKCEMGKEQQGFKRERSKVDGRLTRRQIMENRLDGQENMALGLIYLEKAYYIVPRERERERERATATLRWTGVPEAEVRMVEGTYGEIKGKVEYRRNSGWTSA